MRKLSFAQNQLDMAQCEIKRVNKLADENAVELSKKLEASSETSSQKKKELKATIERLKSETDRQTKELTSIRSDFDTNKRQLETVELEKENFRQSLEESTKKINEVVESLQTANKLVEDYKQRLNKSNEQIEAQEERVKSLEMELQTHKRASQFEQEKKALEVEISRICVATASINCNNESPSKQLAEIQRQLCNYENLLQNSNKSQNDLEKKLDIERREVAQLRQYNKQLEEQFNSQMDIIVELKKRYLDLNAKKNENSKSHESISWTSSGDSDEQYHTEETKSEEAYDGVYTKKKVIA